MEPQLPEFTDFKLQCEKKQIEVKGKKIEIAYGRMMHIFYLCEHSDTCKHKLSCLYKFSEEFYFCENCKILMNGLPGYQIKTKSRFCKNCGKTVEKSLMANARLAGL